MDMNGSRVEITRMVLVEERMCQDDSPYTYGYSFPSIAMFFPCPR